MLRDTLFQSVQIKLAPVVFLAILIIGFTQSAHCQSSASTSITNRSQKQIGKDIDQGVAPVYEKMRPIKKDADEIDRKMAIDTFTWIAYRDATLQLARDGKDSPLFKAYRDISVEEGENDLPRPTIDRYERIYENTAGFRMHLPPGYAIRKYAMWTVALYYYRLADGVAGDIVVRFNGLSDATPHDKNIKFVHEHRAEIDQLTENTLKLMGIEPPPES